MDRKRNITLITEEDIAAIINNSVQGKANRLVGDATEQKKMFVRPIANTDKTPSVMWYLQRLISEIIDAISEGDGTLDALEIAVDENTEDITDNAKQIDELQNTVADKQDKLGFAGYYDKTVSPVVTLAYHNTALARKQDNLTFDGMYSPTANPVATVQTVANKLAEIIGNAPESLNTLEEIAAWIAAHPEDIAELNALIAQNTQSIEALQKRQSELIVKNIQQDGRFVDIEEDIARLQYEDDVLHTNITQNDESLSELRQEFEDYVSGGGFGVDDETVKAIVEEETSPKFEEIESDITVIKRDLTNKQGTVSFDGDYNATTNKAATVATVSREIAKLVADAPEAFNTLEEIAKWIAEHPESVAQLNALIAQNAEAIAQLQETAVTKTNVEETVDSALEEAKASGEFDGPRGTGILNTTTGIAAYTTAVNGVTPSYRILLSTLKTQAKVNEVLIGDSVRYSFYLYPVITMDETYAYLGTRVSIRGAAGAKGDNYVLTDEDKTEIADIVAGDTKTPDYVKVEAEEVADKVIATRTANSLVLLMGTDIHEVASEDTSFDNNKTAIKHLGMGMAEIRKCTRPDAVVLLGDYVYEVSPLDKELAINAMKDVIEKMYNATNGIPSIWLDGNHDHYQTSGDYRLTDGENYALVGANNSQEVEVDVDNVTRNYGYIDFKKQRIRLIYLNTTDISGGIESSNYITNTQGQWLINTALDMSGKDDADKWGIVVCSHFPIYTEQVSTGTLIFPDLKEVICAYKDKSSGTAYGTSYDFSSATAELIATFHGHIHNFKVTDVETDGGNIVKAICIPNGCPNRENPYGGVFQEVDESGNAVSYPKTAGTAEDTSFNAVVIDRDNNKIYAYCYGAGYDREISYESSKPTVVNQISISTDAAGAIYNGVGYKDGIRFGSDGADRTGAATDATGFIPCTIADTLYFKNCQIAVLGGTSQTYQEIACYDSSKTYISKRSVDISAQMDGKDYSVDSDNNLTRYNCADLWTNTAFVRISGNYIGADSVITKNEPID